MSIPTIRTPRSPFVRSARSSAAVPGAPEAVTRTVMSRISRAMLLVARVDAAVDQLEQRVGQALGHGGMRVLFLAIAAGFSAGALAFSAAVRRGDGVGEEE